MSSLTAYNWYEELQTINTLLLDFQYFDSKFVAFHHLLAANLRFVNQQNAAAELYKDLDTGSDLGIFKAWGGGEMFWDILRPSLISKKITLIKYM